MRRQHILQGAILALAWLGTGPAMAQGIYRCGDSYSQQPCPGGRLVPTDDARSAHQGAQTSQAAERDAKAADAMEKARLKEEAKAPPGFVYPDRASAEPAPAAPSSARQNPKIPAHFTAVAPAKPGQPPAAKKKAKKKKA